MAVTDEDLQKLGKPPIYSGKEDEWNEWSFVMKSYVSLLSTHVPALLAGAENPAASPDMSIATIRATLTEDGVTAAKKLFHVLVMNVRGPALAVIRGITDMNGALAWRALITRYAPNTAPRVQSLMSAILNAKTFPSELTAYEIALDEWQENIRKWESISGDRFNASMKKALFLDKAPTNVRVPLQMQNLATFEAMTAVTLQFLQHNAQYQAGVTVTPSNRRGPDDMEIDALTKKGKGKNKGKSKTDGSKTSCFVCGRGGHMAKDCWFKDTSKGSAPNSKGKKGKGKGKGKGKSGVNEVTTPTESAPVPPGGNSTSQISRITQDDTWNRLVPMDEDEDDEFETGYILATIRHRETFIQSKDWQIVRVLVDNCADEHVCSPRDFEWIAIEPSRDPHLVSASGHKLKHYGEQAVPMKLRDGRKIWITFQVCEVNGPIMSVGKFCAKGNDRCAAFSTRGGTLWHEEAGEIAVDKVRNHYEMECWIKPGSVLAPVQFGGSSGSAGEPAEHHVAVPQRTDAEILMDAQPQGAYAPRADEEHIEPEILPVASLPGPREPSKEEIEKHNLLHDPAMPWCDICIQSKSRDDFHRQARPKVLPVIQFDYAVAGAQQGQPHFDFMVGTDMSTGAAWASAVLIKGREDPYIVSSILSWLSELGHSKVIIQSDGEPASEIVMRMVQSKGAMMEHPPCEIIQQQSQRYSHQSNGGAERMVQTIRNQIKAYKIQIEKNSGITIKADSPLLTWLPRHAAWQYTRFHKRQDSTTTAYEKIRHMSYQNPILLVGEAVACRRPGALVNKLESAWLEGIWLGRDSKTDEHLIGTPNGMVRSRALKRRVERRRWDVTLLNAMIWDPWKPTPVTRGRPLKVRSDREPILMGPIPRVQVNPPDDPDTVATAAPAASNLETASGTTTQSQSVAERTRVRLPESEAEGAPPVRKTRTTVPVTTTAETMATTTPTARALVERVGDEAGEDSQPVQMRRIAALMTECEDACTSEAIAEARRVHLEKLTKVKDAVIKVVPRTDATTKPLTGRWVDTMHDDGARKARWTTRGYEQTLNGNEDFFSATPAMMHLKMMLVEAALKGHVAAIGDCSGAFYQSPLNPDGTENQVWIEPPPEAELGPDYIWEAVSAFPGLKGAPRAWDSYSAGVLTNSMQMKQSQYDGCLFYRFEQERIEEKAGRHIDDFLVTGPEPNVERFLEQARDKLNMQDAVRLYKTGDEGRLLAMNLRKMDNGYSLQGKPLLIHRIATALGMENAKTSPIPETINEKAQDGDEESLTPSEARNFRTCVGKAMYLSHHRPDIQHSVNTLSRSMRNPTVIAMRRLKKLTRYLLGTSEVYQELCPDPHAETLQVPVDSDWADDRKTRQSCSGGAVLFHGCAVLTWARTQKTRALSSAEAELYGIGSGAIEGLGASQLLREWQYETVPLLQTDSQSALAVCKRRGPGRMKHIELKMLAVQEWLKTGRLRIHKVSTHDNPADLMTKAMNREKLIKFGRALNLRGAFFTDLSQSAQ